MIRSAKAAIDRLMLRYMHDRLENSLVGLRTRIPELSDDDILIIERVRPFTMTAPERIWACMQAARYASARGLEGDFVECGVWRGGSSMAAALSFLGQADVMRTLWLFDTYEGMTRPIAADVSFFSKSDAMQKWDRSKTSEGSSDWCCAGIDEVRANLFSTGYPQERIRFIKGPVEQTLLLDENIPHKIALLRLDTDWYESTKVELEVLFDRLVIGGVLILDDYGHWAGAKQAVDEFLEARGLSYMMHRIDRTGRAVIKT